MVGLDLPVRVKVQVFDRIVVVLTRLLVVALLHHNRPDIGQTDALLFVILVEFRVNVIGISIAEKGLCLLLFALLYSHGLGCKGHGAGHAIEGQVQLVKLLARVFVAELNGAFALAVVRDLVEGLIEVDDLRCHFLRQSLDSHDAKDDQQGRHEERYDHHLIEHVLNEHLVQIIDPGCHLGPFDEEGELQVLVIDYSFRWIGNFGCIVGDLFSRRGLQLKLPKVYERVLRHVEELYIFLAAIKTVGKLEIDPSPRHVLVVVDSGSLGPRLDL